MDDDPLHPYRAELRAHCYRMLGSVHDTEDVLQEVALRAWRGRDTFEGRSSRRTWLHRIASNACLNELQRKERRVLPVDVAERATGAPDLERRLEIPWLEPLADDPHQSAEGRESLELAFVAAVQHLTPNQRAALVMFDVLGFSAVEVAETMRTSPASVHSTLSRARLVLADLGPRASQRAALEDLGPGGQQELVRRYTEALRTHDLAGLLTLLTEDATWSMPPLVGWYAGPAAITSFLLAGPFEVDWRHRVTTANGQLAVAAYARFDEDRTDHAAYALDVLTVRDGRIAAVTSFLEPSLFEAFGLPRNVTS
ncbi:RNA polymerase subunit sigma-70 [Nocardioides sp.]|uniref:RNA polymerase subunit sigma-70 n=1 Tax=Nocardioides sp. TaxID=35761 RepID=UPI002716406A|nr:RNA polymerase subunit sigma-70 [Nocardioides sp.]MDO9456337.1 RNA polymerase subunit sigma-70 [Nocardioides sp.]